MVLVALVFSLMCCTQNTKKKEAFDTGVSISQKDTISFCHMDTLLIFDFSHNPLKSDIELLNSDFIKRCLVKNESILNVIKEKRNYYHLYAYSHIPSNRDVYTLFGYYDYYYDIILISLTSNGLVDWEIIASTSGDAEDFQEIKSKFISKNEVEITEVQGKYDYSTRDTIESQMNKRSILTIESNGHFNIQILK